MIEGGLQTTGVACGQFAGYGFFSSTVVRSCWHSASSCSDCVLLHQFLPESPRRLIKHGMLKKGTYNLAQLRGLPEDDPSPLAERDVIVASFEAQAGEAPFSYRELLSSGRLRPSTASQ
jgi:hypothetical protein